MSTRRSCRSTLGLLALALLFFAGQASARVLDYRIDPVHTQVLFSVDHNGFSHPVGRLRIKAGWLRFDQDDWSTAKVVADIDAASVDLGDKEWGDAVTDKRFLDAKDFPVAHFESTSVEKKGASNGPRHCLQPEDKTSACAEDTGDVQQGVLHGNLTLRGVTQEVAIPFTVNRLGTTIFGMQTLAGFSGRTTLDRMQFGITAFPKAVGEQVEVRLEVEAILDQDAQKQYEASRGATGTNRDADDAAAQH